MSAEFPAALLKQFHAWLSEAKGHRVIKEPMAMNLATCTLNGYPSSRMVLLKDCTPEGLTFYTNLESRKSSEIRKNPHAALCFYWMPLGKQIRLEGILKSVSRTEADAYFATRPRLSQLGAWASAQSRPLKNRAALAAAVARLEVKYAGKKIPRPPHWGGWRLIPQTIEFWEEGKFRLHKREVYTRDQKGRWRKQLLYP